MLANKFAGMIRPYGGAQRYMHPVGDDAWDTAGDGAQRYMHPVGDDGWDTVGDGAQRYMHPVGMMGGTRWANRGE